MVEETGTTGMVNHLRLKDLHWQTDEPLMRPHPRIYLHLHRLDHALWPAKPGAEGIPEIEMEGTEGIRGKEALLLSMDIRDLMRAAVAYVRA